MSSRECVSFDPAPLLGYSQNPANSNVSPTYPFSARNPFVSPTYAKTGGIPPVGIVFYGVRQQSCRLCPSRFPGFWLKAMTYGLQLSPFPASLTQTPGVPSPLSVTGYLYEQTALYRRTVRNPMAKIAFKGLGIFLNLFVGRWSGLGRSCDAFNL